MHFAKMVLIAVMGKATTGLLAAALLLVVPGQSFGQQASLAPCRDQLLMYQNDRVTPGLAQAAANWHCPEPNARTMPVPRPSSQSPAGGGIPIGFPTTEGQAQAFVLGTLFQVLMSGGPSANEQQQQALLQQQQAEEKLKAEILQKERAAQASEARVLWESQDAARSQELANLFGPATQTAEGTSSLLQKQAALQLRAAAAPGRPGTDEDLRRRAGEGFDEAGKTLAAVPDVPEPEAPLDRRLVLARIDATKARLETLELELETVRKKQEQTRQKLEQARRELAAKQAEPAPTTPQDDAALLAALEAEEQNIEALSKELEKQRYKAVQELETWNAKLEPAKP
jgi:chaperonin cofactor prefoldin